MKKHYFLILVFALLASCSQIKNINESDLAFPVYGNYCGPSHPKKGTNPKPIDETDLACRMHDACYELNGYLYAKCDEELIINLKKITPKSEPEKYASKLIISYFDKSPKVK